MRPLRDAHTLIWALDDPSRLGIQAVIELKNTANQLLLSAGTIWELAIKVGLKKLTLSLPYRQWLTKAIADLVKDAQSNWRAARRQPAGTAGERRGVSPPVLLATGGLTPRRSPRIQ